MIRNIIAFILLVGTGGLLLTETILKLNNPTLLFLIAIAGIFFVSGIYYHFKSLQS